MQHNKYKQNNYNKQLEVNPSGVVAGTWWSFPGVRPGLLEADTPGVGLETSARESRMDLSARITGNPHPGCQARIILLPVITRIINTNIQIPGKSWTINRVLIAV